jgi:hypothetical protein
MLSALGALLVVATTTGPMTTHVPLAETAVTELAPEGLLHREVLRIDRDFGKPQFDIVVDTWMDADTRAALVDVRMWWVKTDAQDRRSPFSAKLRRYLDLETRAEAPARWQLEMRGDRKEFAFAVEIDGRGRPAAFVDVVTDDGRKIQHCRTTSAKLRARRLLGIPIGVAALDVTCVDANGRRQRGEVRYRKLTRGDLYRGE